LIIDNGRRNADAADQTDMHVRSPPCDRPL
jgi:hypothetical protein